MTTQNGIIQCSWERLCGSGHAHPFGDTIWASLLHRLPTGPGERCALVAADLGGAAASLSSRRQIHVTTCNVTQTAQELSRVRTMASRRDDLHVLDGSWQFALRALRPASHESAVLWDIINFDDVRVCRKLQLPCNVAWRSYHMLTICSWASLE